jgi:3-oxoacyl-[acyl-carrier protein] reductase
VDLGLRDRVAIVGGSSKGMGRATAIALAREGAMVTLCARTQSDLRKVEMEIARTASQRHVLAIPADLSKPENIRLVVRDTFNRFERIDVVVNNIGGPPPGKPSELKDQEWYDALEQNFMSAIRMSREVIPYMKQQRWGRIINLLSNAVRQPVLNLVLSTSSRLAVVGYAKMLSNELAGFNITVNNVLPGQVMTDRMTSLYTAMAEGEDRTAEELMKEAAHQIPMQRLGRAEEMGDLITFLASERAAYITGQNISLDGGSLTSTI